LFAGAGQDHGAVGWPGQDPRLWHLQHESDCSGVGQGPGPSVELLLAGADSREAVDPRSNLFTLGAILYEMAVGRKAFEGADPVALVNQIELEMPAKPLSVNAKIHPLLSELIMKALAKDPAERYQSSRELLEDLEQCKESGKKAAAADTKKPALATSAAVSSARAAASSKFVSSGASAAAPVPSDRPAVGNKASAAVAAPRMEPAFPRPQMSVVRMRARTTTRTRVRDSSAILR